MTEPRPKPDGRSSMARRHRVLAENFAADLGGMTKLSYAERELVDLAALILTRVDHMRDRIISGDSSIDDDAIVRLSNSAARILTALGVQRRKRQPAHVPLRDRLSNDGE